VAAMPDTTTATANVNAPRVSRPGRGRVFDAGDPRHAGLPTWTQDAVPGHLRTRRELAARGLRPGRRTVCGLVLWADQRGARCAPLYDTTQAVPRVPRLRRATTQPG
jgi:hypothetical protein